MVFFTKILRRNENGVFKGYYCNRCKRKLAEIFETSMAYQVIVTKDCQHLKWFSVGNGCYPVELDFVICKGTKEIASKSVLVLENGTTYYFLVPVEVSR
jgi:hypothetical protein